MEVTASQVPTVDYDAISATQNITVNPDLVTGLIGWTDNPIQFFPNPAQSIIRLTGISVHDEIILIDQRGIVVKRWKVDFRTTDLNIEGVVPGLYIIKAYRENKETAAQRILTY